MSDTYPTIKRPHITAQVVFLDGLTGTGKTLMGPVLGSFHRVQLGQFQHIHEHVCGLDYLGKIERDAAAFLVSMYADLALYNGMIAREANFRPTDLSGAFSNPHPWRCIRRLFLKDGDEVGQRINAEQPILHLISHQMLGIAGPVFDGLGERVRFVRMVRHPFYLLEHWHSYIDRHGTDPRDFTICFRHHDVDLPWFAKGMEDIYTQASAMDRVIYAIDKIFRMEEDVIAQRPTPARDQILTIPFEKFVLDPEPFLKEIGTLLGTTPDRVIAKTLREQKVPRLQVAAGPNKEIYRRYAWSKPTAGLPDREELNRKKQFALDRATPQAVTILEKLADFYEKKYGLWF